MNQNFTKEDAVFLVLSKYFELEIMTILASNPIC
jgi:hypothetical protein